MGLGQGSAAGDRRHPVRGLDAIASGSRPGRARNTVCPRRLSGSTPRAQVQRRPIPLARIRNGGRLRLVQGQRRRTAACRRRQEAERVGAVRHARQRCRVDGGQVRSRLLRQGVRDLAVQRPRQGAVSACGARGSWDDEAAKLRVAARRSSTEAWSRRDPQNPKSLWWHTDATFVGFRVVAEVDNSAK